MKGWNEKFPPINLLNYPRKEADKMERLQCMAEFTDKYGGELTVEKKQEYLGLLVTYTNKNLTFSKIIASELELPSTYREIKEELEGNNGH
jgi:hypothetical protein